MKFGSHTPEQMPELIAAMTKTFDKKQEALDFARTKLKDQQINVAKIMKDFDDAAEDLAQGLGRFLKSFPEGIVARAIRVMNEKPLEKVTPTGDGRSPIGDR